MPKVETNLLKSAGKGRLGALGIPSHTPQLKTAVFLTSLDFPIHRQGVRLIGQAIEYERLRADTDA